MVNNFSICYIFRDRAGPYTPFMSFPKSHPEFDQALQHVNLLPLSIPELLSSREEIARKRLDNIYHGRIIEFVSSTNPIEKLPYIFKVFLIENTDTENLNRDDIFYIALHESQATAETPYYKNVTYDTLRTFYFSKIQSKDPSYKTLDDNYTPLTPITAATRSPRNIHTNCNIEIANSLGIIIEDTSGESAGHNRDIEKSINLLNAIRNDLQKNYPSKLAISRSEYLITDFTVDLEYSINSKSYTKHALMHDNTPDHINLSESITYAKSQSTIDKDSDNPLINLYHQEQYLGSVLNSLYATASLTPEIKIDICNNDLFPITSAMRGNITSNNQKSLNKQMLDFTKTVLSKSNTMLDYISKSTNKQIKIISNLPIEWTNLNGLPLMIRHNTSRIFASPGFIRTKLTLNNHEIAIPLESLSKVLVISSFAEGECISNHLKVELKRVINESDDPKIKELIREKIDAHAYHPDHKPQVVFEDVKNKDDIIAALNKDRYGIVIFDMHGGHEKNTEGLLELSDEILSPYDLVGKADVPPIVILSACDTSPADRSHFNAANAFLCAGAVTVLASTYPINSLAAARYIGKLYRRIRLYLPERIFSLKKSIRWSEFITGLNRRVFFEDFIDHIKKKYKYITAGQISAAKIEFLHALEVNPGGFLDELYYALTKSTKLPRETIFAELSKHFTYSECLNYVQIGSPERIMILAEDITNPN